MDSAAVYWKRRERNTTNENIALHERTRFDYADRRMLQEGKAPFDGRNDLLIGRRTDI